MASQEVQQDSGARGMATLMPWWFFLITGVAWMLIAIVVLRYNVHPTTSVATVGVLIGALFLVACVNEFAMIGRAEGWKWLHAVLGRRVRSGGALGLLRADRHVLRPGVGDRVPVRVLGNDDDHRERDDP